VSLRPKKCEILDVASQDADAFYESFHYIVKCRPSISYGAFHQGRLVACISFKAPTRQSSYQFELVRMASDPEYRIHGIWIKLFRKFVCDQHPKSVVSFSDNRLFNGRVYPKIGFSFDGKVSPNYYWTKDGVRHNKSGLRKKNEEKNSGLTEVQLRQAQGYHKIWDLGKKRWVWNHVKFP
jgi:hypothetical protein